MPEISGVLIGNVGTFCVLEANLTSYPPFKTNQKSPIAAYSDTQKCILRSEEPGPNQMFVAGQILLDGTRLGTSGPIMVAPDTFQQTLRMENNAMDRSTWWKFTAFSFEGAPFVVRHQISCNVNGVDLLWTSAGPGQQINLKPYDPNNLDSQLWFIVESSD